MAKARALEQGTQEWLDWRRNGITATEASAAAGVSKWATPLSVYTEKLNPKPHETSKYEEWGTLLEDVIKFRKFAASHPEFFVVQGQCYEDGWKLCSLDGELKQGNETVAILEIKTGRSAADWNPVPPYYYAQVQWQMHVTGIRKVYFAVLINGCDYFERIVDYDPKYCEELEEKCAALWQCILNKTPPEPTNPEIDSPIVLDNTLTSIPDDKTFEVPENEVKQYMVLKDQKDRIDFKLGQLKMKFTSYLGKARRLTYAGGTFASIVTRAGTQSVDSKLLKQLFPDVYEKVLKRGASSSYIKIG